MGCLILFMSLAGLVVLSGVVITLVWNWTVTYLAWSLFSYTLPHMTVWQGICVYFVIAVICVVSKGRVGDDDD